MTNKRMTRAEVIRWLGDAISTETEKPFEEIDYDFVEECGCLLDELMGKSAAMSEEEIVVRMEKLKPDTTSAVRKKVGRRRLWKIVVAAVVVLCMCMTVVAIPELRVRLLNVLQLNVGESVVEDGITYIHSGKTTQYDDIGSLITSENLDILSFEDPQGKIKVTSINHIEDASMTTITFNDPTINLYITHNQNRITNGIIEASEKYSTLDFTAYILSKMDSETPLYNAYIYYNNATYFLECSTESTMFNLLNSFTKGK